MEFIMNFLLNTNTTLDFSEFLEKAKSIFLNFNVTDAIDIALLTAIFLLLLSFFRNRKAGTLLVGVVFLLVVYGASFIFNFNGVRFILSGVFQIGALALVIIFQPEIRDMLEKVGYGSLRGIRGIGDQSKKKQTQYKAIDSVCKAVKAMSAEKTGALIVISRTTQLDDVLHSGTMLNADVSDSLIRNLFFNRAPLHDGAIVIEEGKISAAACILPLPKHTHVDSELGTRHRAAVGLSEVSDAVVVVVSEETGQISVAVESELKRDFTAEELRKFLVGALIRDKSSAEQHENKTTKQS